MTVARGLGRAFAGTLAALTLLFMGSTASALAAPVLTLESPAGATETNDATPPFEGTTSDILDPITVALYEGSSASGSPVQTSAEVLPTLLGQWAITLAEPLQSGQYTAVATQPETASGEDGASEPVTFVVDTIAPSVSLNSISSPTNDATPTFSGGAGSASGDAGNVTLKVYEGSSVGGPVAETLVVPRSGSSWSQPIGALPDGTYTAQAAQEDSAGNVGKSGAVTFTIDTQKPSVSIDPVASPTSDSTPTITGSAGTLTGDHSSVAVAIRHEGSIVRGSPSVAVIGGKWSYTPSSLPDGAYTVEVLQEDAAGNEGSAGPVAFTIDTHTPAVTIESLPSALKDPTPTLSGSAGAQPGDGEEVQVVVHKGSISGEVVESTSVVRSGSIWSHTTGALPDGTYTAQALQKDEAGTKGESPAMTFTVDTHAPLVSIDKVVTLTKDSTPTFTGGAGAAAGDHSTVTVVIRKEGAVVRESQSVSVSSEKWSYTPSSLPDGIYSVQVSQSDAAGNLGTAESVAFTIDTHTPTVSIEALSTPTNNPTPTLAGAAGALPGDDASVLVVVHEGSIGGKVIESVSVARSGSSWSHTTTTLADGTYVAQALQEDEAGARGESSAVTFVVDTHAPTVSIDPVATPTKDGTPTFTGSAGALTGDHPVVAVVIKQGGSVVNEAKSVSVSGGKWSYTVPSGASLADGAYTVQVSQSDAAGNVGLVGPVAFVVDTNAPKPTIDPLASVTNDSTPRFTGTAGTRVLDDNTVRLAIYKGTTIVGTPVAESAEVPVSSGAWSYTAPTLADGTYTAQVEQQDKANERGTSAIVFTVDATAPHVTLAHPSNEEILVTAQPTFSGLAGVETGDQASVSLSVYAGAAASGSPLQTLKIAVNHGEWSSGASISSLPNGFYTAVVDQTDEAGNDGRSVSTFVISVPPPVTTAPTAPTASFSWFPTAPRVGEPVSLVSTSTPGSSPISGFAWNVNGGTGLTAGPSVLATTFSTPGPHLVRLQVTDANGLSGATAETIAVARAAAVLMQPFPVVRIAGSGSARSIKISLFTVLAPTGATVTVNCHGHGCPSAPQSIIARAGRNHRRAATVLISFTRFERSLRAGAVLEIRVTRKGQIGKYTRFTIRRGKLPARLDTCLSPSGVTPMSCPS